MRQIGFFERKALEEWIPADCQEQLSQLKCTLAPSSGLFVGDDAITIGSSGNGFELIKIHGSINWFQTKNDKVKVGAPDHPNDEPFIVYPEADKSAFANSPLYCRLLEAAIRALDEFDLAVILGYSIPESDSHNHPFVSKFVNYLPRKLVIIDPFPSERIERLVRSQDTFIQSGIEFLFNPHFHVQGKSLRDFLFELRSEST